MRVSKTTRNILRELAMKLGESMQAILDKAIEDYRRRMIFEEANKAYAALRSNPDAWKAELQERTEWDATLMDGLDSSEQWDKDGKVVVHD
jgi:predicted transcriptional regulator